MDDPPFVGTAPSRFFDRLVLPLFLDGMVVGLFLLQYDYRNDWGVARVTMRGLSWPQPLEVGGILA